MTQLLMTLDRILKFIEKNPDPSAPSFTSLLKEQLGLSSVEELNLYINQFTYIYEHNSHPAILSIEALTLPSCSKIQFFHPLQRERSDILSLTKTSALDYSVMQIWFAVKKKNLLRNNSFTQVYNYLRVDQEEMDTALQRLDLSFEKLNRILTLKKLKIAYGSKHAVTLKKWIQVLENTNKKPKVEKVNRVSKGSVMLSNVISLDSSSEPPETNINPSPQLTQLNNTNNSQSSQTILDRIGIDGVKRKRTSPVESEKPETNSMSNEVYQFQLLEPLNDPALEQFLNEISGTNIEFSIFNL